MRCARASFILAAAAASGIVALGDTPDDLTTGACCKADQTCVENMTQADCEAIAGAWWAGPGTICDDCHWIPDCPPGAHVESEPCGESRNPGCDREPPKFESVPTSGVVCGTAWADGGERDEDWYQILLTADGRVVIREVQTQLPIRITPLVGPYHASPPECDELYSYGDTLYEPGIPRPPFQTPDVLMAGRYWIHVTPEDADGPVTSGYPCGSANEYRFELAAEYVGCPEACFDIPGIAIHDDWEPDYCRYPAPDTYNSGCDVPIWPPGPYLPITDDGWLWCAHSGWYDLPPQSCPGDMNCDDQIDFGDINPFVLALSDWAGWVAAYPNCPPRNADINGDGLYGGFEGFGDINAFVALVASGGGQPVQCSHEPAPTPDTDWWEFTIAPGAARTAMIFSYSAFPLIWEVYDAIVGCRAVPLERHTTSPCSSSSIRTRCLPPGNYWLRFIPPPGVDCGMEYVVALEEFQTCQPCSEACESTDTPENESCGEHLNDDCGATAMTIPDPYWPTQSVICGTSYNLLRPEESDEDWYQFDIPPGEGQYLVVVLNSDMPLTPWITIDGCEGPGWLVRDGIQCDPDGELTGFYIDKQHVPGGSHVDLRITPELWNVTYTWYRNPWHAPCEQTYRLIAGYSPTEPQPGDFGVATFKRLETAGRGERACGLFEGGAGVPPASQR